MSRRISRGRRAHLMELCERATAPLYVLTVGRGPNAIEELNAACARFGVEGWSFMVMPSGSSIHIVHPTAKRGIPRPHPSEPAILVV